MHTGLNIFKYQNNVISFNIIIKLLQDQSMQILTVKNWNYETGETRQYNWCWWAMSR